MSDLDLRLHLGTAAMRIRIAGNLDATNAHLLSKVAVGCLRRFPLPILELDLTHVVQLDQVGLSAIQDCERCAERRGVLFNVVGARHLLSLRPPPRQPQTGTICLSPRWP